MGIHEYSYERHIQAIQDESYDNGIKDTTDLFSWLKSQNRHEDILKAIDDPIYLDKLFEEYKGKKLADTTV